MANSKPSYPPPSDSIRTLSLWISIFQIGVWFLVLWVNMALEISIYLLPFQILLQSFLFVGLFIVAHDCMHGIVGPKSGIANKVLGSICAFLFAGFSYKKLKVKHAEHHNFLVTDKDPDYTSGNNESFFVWLKSFIVRYFGIRELLVLNIHVITLYYLSGSYLKVILFFAIPSWIASLQLFYFGTYRPHRHFPDTEEVEIKARSNNYPVWLSFLTCYHFGYHEEHHRYPYLAWWRLPQAYKQDKNTLRENLV